MKVLICGSRDWENTHQIKRRMQELPKGTLLIAGGNGAADKSAEAWARFLGLHMAVIEALWHKYGKRAGPVRNRAMLSLDPDLIIAFHKNDSPGTRDMLKEARRKGIEVEVHKPE